MLVSVLISMAVGGHTQLHTDLGSRRKATDAEWRRLCMFHVGVMESHAAVWAAQIRQQSVTARSAAIHIGGVVSLLHAAGGMQEALSHYQRAVEISPSYAPAYYHLGVLYSEAKQVRCASCWWSRRWSRDVHVCVL
jgi:tetratricopeptide (TPR) repeat protein